MRVNVEKRTAKLDQWDYNILEHLTEDSRMSFKEIGRKTLIAPDTVRYRVKRLQAEGVIVKFIPDIAFRQFGYFKYSLFIQLTETDETEFVSFLKEQPHVLSIIKYTDRFDLELVILAKDIIEYDKIVNSILERYDDIIDDVVHFQQIESYKSTFLPKISKPVQKKTGTKYDEIDFKILGLLSKDARMSSHGIAQELGVGADKVVYRIKKMKGNIISRFTTVVNFSAMGYSWYTFLLNLTSLSKKRSQELAEYIRNMPGVIRCVRGIGEWDMIIYIVAKNQAEFHKCINQLRTRFRSIIKDYDTLLAYKELKFEEFHSKDLNYS